MRGATGHNWDGSETSWAHAPAQYGAIHFHDDDLEDAAWTPAFSLTVPEGLKSGFYAVHLDTGNGSDTLPFVVASGRDRA